MNRISKQIPSIIKKAAIISGSLVGVLLLAWSLLHDTVSTNLPSPYFIWMAVLGSLMLFSSLISAFRPAEKAVNMNLLISSSAMVYIVVEIFTYVLVLTGSVHVASNKLTLDLYNKRTKRIVLFSKPAAKANLTSGVKWIPENARIMGVYNDIVVFDNYIKGNNMGYLSIQRFRKKKPPKTLRIIVLGDSFTSGSNLSLNWPDKATGLIKTLTGKDIEFYPFANDAIGLANWHLIFFNEIAGQIEFDGLIFAVWGNDFSRDYTLLNSDNNYIYGNHEFKKLPKNSYEYQQEVKQLEALGLVVSNNKIDEIKEEYSKDHWFNYRPPDLYFARKLFNEIENYKEQKKNKAGQDNYDEKYRKSHNKKKKYSKEIFVSRYGPEKLRMLTDIIRWCRQHNKHVSFVAIPDIPIIQANAKGETSITQVELQYLAQMYKGDYFDGHKLYTKMNAKELSQHFLYADNHWNQKGSDLFALSYAKYFLKRHFGIIVQ